MKFESPTTQRVMFLTGLIVTVLADQISKLYIRISVPEGAWRNIIPGCVAITHRLNQGIALSFFHHINAAPVIFSLIALGAVGFITWLVIRHPMLPRKVIIALGLIGGGAAGNMIDRIIPPHKVVDFIDCYAGTLHWPAFNIADSAICIGAGLLVLASFTDPQAFSRPASSPPVSSETI